MTITVYFLFCSVKSCFHIMDICKSHPNSCDANNHNNTSLLRPVAPSSTTNLAANFTKIGTLRSQVRPNSIWSFLLLFSLTINHFAFEICINFHISTSSADEVLLWLFY